MKTRQGFVSNSSNSSFIIDPRKLSNAQIDAIKHHATYGKLITFKTATKDQLEEFDKEGNFWSEYGGFKGMERDAWTIWEDDEGMIHADTSMDNFDFEHCKHYFSLNDGLVLNDYAIQHDKELIVSSTMDFSLDTLKRLIKFTKKGYNTSVDNLAIIYNCIKNKNFILEPDLFY